MSHQVTDHDVIRAMDIYGGSFAAHLAKAASHADAQNLARIKIAFADLWATYRRVAEQEAVNVGAAATELYEALAYAVDNPEFDSAEFDRLARAALAKVTQS